MMFHSSAFNGRAVTFCTKNRAYAVSLLPPMNSWCTNFIISWYNGGTMTTATLLWQRRHYDYCNTALTTAPQHDLMTSHMSVATLRQLFSKSAGRSRLDFCYLYKDTAQLAMSLNKSWQNKVDWNL